jgi:hypothetical protein
MLLSKDFETGSEYINPFTLGTRFLFNTEFCNELAPLTGFAAWGLVRLL